MNKFKIGDEVCLKKDGYEQEPYSNKYKFVKADEIYKVQDVFNTFGTFEYVIFGTKNGFCYVTEDKLITKEEQIKELRKKVK
jgi:hypothetical protein